MNVNKENENTKDLAGKIYDVKDYQANDTLSAGIAETHEQASDAYMEGEIHPVIDDLNRKDVEMKSEGYKKESR